jgi:hypothetical protein
MLPTAIDRSRHGRQGLAVVRGNEEDTGGRDHHREIESSPLSLSSSFFFLLAYEAVTSYNPTPLGSMWTNTRRS